jgi:bacterial/archaeal transporter family protein
MSLPRYLSSTPLWSYYTLLIASRKNHRVNAVVQHAILLGMWILYAAGSAVAASLVAIFGKIGLQSVDPTLATILRGIVMAIILTLGGAAFGVFKGFDATAIGGRAWLFIFLAAVAGASSWLLYFLALRYGPASSVAIIDKFSVVLVILLAAAFLGESLTLRSVLGIFLTVAGSLLILFK